MSYINFDFDAADSALGSIRNVVETFENEEKNIQSVIADVEYGWSGAGADAYKLYLDELHGNILKRIQRLYDVIDILNGSIAAARQADEEAAASVSNASTAFVNDPSIDKMKAFLPKKRELSGKGDVPSIGSVTKSKYDR